MRSRTHKEHFYIKKSEPRNDSKVLETFVIGFGLLVLFNGKIIWEGAKRWSVNTTLWMAVIYAPLAWICYMRVWHLYFLLWLGIPRRVLENIYAKGGWENTFVIFLFLAAAHLWVTGLGPYIRRRRTENQLKAVLLKNAVGLGPTVVRMYQENSYREVVTVRAAGIGAERIKASHSAIEAALGREIEMVRTCSNPRFVDLVLVRRDLPEEIHYGDLCHTPARDTFLVGESKNGLKIARIADLPHLLIAGTTGGGKSIFFKQALLALLEGTPNLQMYLIDLKGGIEMKPFSALPNARMAKTADEAVAVLSAVKSEMERRFAFLEKNGLEKIKPGRDPFDRIVVGIDEASVLYTASRKDEDYELVGDARALTEHIAKLSRAAAIHLILATQKVTKETVDTRIQENVSGRMCFKLNTIEGSVRMLGHGKAADLSAIPGRGIWQLGNEEVTVQVPFLTKSALSDRLEKVRALHMSGERKMKQPMLLTEAKPAPFWLGNSEEVMPETLAD